MHLEEKWKMEKNGIEVGGWGIWKGVEWGGWGGGGVVWCGYGVPRGCMEISGEFLVIFREISRKFPKIVGVIRGVQHDTTQRQIKILTHGLDQNDPTIMLNSPVQYLKNFIFTPNWHLSPNPFIYIYVRIRIWNANCTLNFQRSLRSSYLQSLPE